LFPLEISSQTVLGGKKLHSPVKVSCKAVMDLRAPHKAKNLLISSMTIRLLAEILLRSKLYFLNVSQSDKSRKNGDDVQRTKERAKLHFLVGMMLFVFWVEAVTTAN